MLWSACWKRWKNANGESYWARRHLSAIEPVIPVPNCPNSLREMWFLHPQRLTCRWRLTQWRRLLSTVTNSERLADLEFDRARTPPRFDSYNLLPYSFKIITSQNSRFCAGRTKSLHSSELLFWILIWLLLFWSPSPNVDYRPYHSSIFVTKPTGGKIQPEDSSGHLAISARKRHVWFMGYPHCEVELTGCFGLSCISSMHTAGWLITSSTYFLPQWDGRSMFEWQLWVENQPECWGKWWLVPHKLVSL